MDRLFRQSGLLREKWDEVHFADGSTYGEKTIERAISNTSEFYDPGRGNQSKQSQITSEPSGEATTDVGVVVEESTRSQAYLTEKIDSWPSVSTNSKPRLNRKRACRCTRN